MIPASSQLPTNQMTAWFEISRQAGAFSVMNTKRVVIFVGCLPTAASVLKDTEHNLGINSLIYTEVSCLGRSDTNVAPSAGRPRRRAATGPLMDRLPFQSPLGRDQDFTASTLLLALWSSEQPPRRSIYCSEINAEASAVVASQFLKE